MEGCALFSSLSVGIRREPFGEMQSRLIQLPESSLQRALGGLKPPAVYAAIVRNETLRRTKLFDSRVEDNQDTGQVLALKDITGEGSS